MKYIVGENNQLADCLLRLGCLQDKIKLPRLKVHQLTTRLSATSDKLQQIQQATQEDDTMALLKHTITYMVGPRWYKNFQKNSRPIGPSEKK